MLNKKALWKTRRNSIRDYWRQKNMQTIDGKTTGIFDEH